MWNIGTGYFGCGSGGMQRTFDEGQYKANATRDNCVMVELKLSQGAKPAHGGMLPRAKISKVNPFHLQRPNPADCICP